MISFQTISLYGSSIRYIESLFLPQLNASRLPLYRINSTSPLPEFSVVNDSSSSQPVVISSFLYLVPFPIMGHSSHPAIALAYSLCSLSLIHSLLNYGKNACNQAKCNPHFTPFFSSQTSFQACFFQ